MAITDPKYIEQYSQIHSEKEWGNSSVIFKYPVILALVERQPKTVLDYGCGQSPLYQEIAINKSIEILRYDPSIPEISTPPVKKVDLIINTDVLEHIPESDLDDVLTHMKSLSNHVFFNISTRLAGETLPSGENAHCTVYPAEWWQKKLSNHFPDSTIVRIDEGEDCTIVTWKPAYGELYSVLQDGFTYRRKKAKVKLRLRDKIKRKLKKIK